MTKSRDRRPKALCIGGHLDGEVVGDTPSLPPTSEYRRIRINHLPTNQHVFAFVHETMSDGEAASAMGDLVAADTSLIKRVFRQS